jgi:hypothetical protein
MIETERSILHGHVLRNKETFTTRGASADEKQEITWKHPAAVFAHQQNMYIIMTPISLFSDGTSGNISKQ